MHFRRFWPLLALLSSASSLLAQRERDMIRELQRDMALLQENVKTLNSKFDEKIAVITTLLQQSLEESKAANRAVAVLDRQLRDGLREQQNMVAAPVAGLGNKVDQMGMDFSALKETVAELNSRLARMQTQLSDVAVAVKMIGASQAPPPPPPTQSGGPPQGLDAQELYNNGLRDRQTGNLDLALEHFQNYLRWFPKTELAPNAQFYIGDILYNKGDYEAAIQAFDAVVESYPENSKSADALYMKGQAQLKADRKSQASQTLNEVVRRYPNSEAAGKAKLLLRGLGRPASSPASTARKRR
ncbi:MAG: tol-pal system protein YbgF [Bryobacteraceae bacterium]|nr:tol-pal system protein YbgF [Bryobacteraceae bacterium]MDW8379193.1 tol-pal system protein YbgF [Bryobacterales bacterium]